MRHIDLSGMSVEALRALSKKALKLAEDLKSERPTLKLALEHGIKSQGYKTVSHGWVDSYSGNVLIKMENGSLWRAIGHSPEGSPEWIDRQGWVEFIKCESDEDFKKRVEERTDLSLDSIPEGSKEDVIGGHIFCKRTTLEGHQEYVMGVGYPEQTSDGDEIYNQFVRVVLS